MSLTMYAKEFLAMHFAFDEFAHILWGVKKPTIVMTDNKALTRFFQSKRIPPKLWNYCNQTLQFEFVLAHVPGTENPAADYLSRLDIRPEERIHLKLNDEIPVFHVEIDLASRTPNHDEEEEEYIPDDQHATTTKQNEAILDRVPMCSNESSGQFLERIETIRHQITPIITGQHDEMTFTRFRRKLHDNVVNQVCPNGEFQIIQDQVVNLDIQRMSFEPKGNPS